MKTLLRLLTWIALLSAQGAALAQAYPAKPVRIVISFGPGSALDVIARIYGEDMRVMFNQPFLVEYKPGASGRIGAEFAARAAPDGYTLYVGSNTSHSANPYLFKKLNYDPVKDFTPISYLVTNTSVLVVDPNLPVKSVSELIAYGKANPGKLNCSYGNTSAQVACASFYLRSGITGLEVPYKTNELAVADILSGIASINFVALSSGSALIKSGKVRMLGVAKASRSVLVPDVPAVAETPGLAGFDIASWVGLFGPAGLSRPIVDTLNGAIRKVAAKKEIRERFAQLSTEVETSSPEELGELVIRQLDNWGRRIKEARIEPE